MNNQAIEQVYEEKVTRHPGQSHINKFPGESHIEWLCREIAYQYNINPAGDTKCGGSFAELLCWEMHTNNQTFSSLAKKWGISVTLMGELILDHCKKLEPLPKVNFDDDSALKIVG